MKKNFYKSEYFKIFGSEAPGVLALKLYLIISDRCEEYGVCTLSQAQLSFLLETSKGRPTNRGMQKALKSLIGAKLIKKLPSPSNKATSYLDVGGNNLVVSEEQVTNPHPGIYAIESNEGIYVGQSKNISSRLEQHRSSILRGKHPYIKNSNFKFEILEECDDLQDLSLLEAKWALDFHNSGMKVLNISNFTSEDK